MDISLNSGTAYAYTGGRTPDPDRPGVAFIHGAGLDHTVWTLPARYFCRHGFNVLALDLPGHGRSDGPALSSIESMADWVATALRKTGIAPAALVGHSMGSLVALDAASRYPSLARSLALLGTANPMRVSGALLGNAQSNDHMAIDMLTVWGHSRAAQIGGSETPGIWMVGSTLRLFERAAPGVIFNDLNACNEYEAGSARAAAVRCPTLVIVGDRDIMTSPRNAGAIAASIPGARTEVLPGCGHSMLLERPDAVLDALITIV